MTLDAFARLLQLSISPIALISGASLLLLSITNRMGRTIDRSRSLVREIESGENPRLHDDHKEQLKILLRRSRYLRKAVLCISASIFQSSLMILTVFLEVFLDWPLKGLVLGLLFLSVVFLCLSVIYLFLDVSASLNALHLEVKRHI